MGDDRMVSISVGGKDTLASHGGMLKGIAEGSVPSTADASGRPILECDPDLFKYVANFLRRGKAFLPPEFALWDELRAEFDFLGLPFPQDAQNAQQGVQEAKREASRKRALSPSRVVLSYAHHADYTNAGVDDYAGRFMVAKEQIKNSKDDKVFCKPGEKMRVLGLAGEEKAAGLKYYATNNKAEEMNADDREPDAAHCGHHRVR
eukprot:gene3291-52924_t